MKTVHSFFNLFLYFLPRFTGLFLRQYIFLAFLFRLVIGPPFSCWAIGVHCTVCSRGLFFAQKDCRNVQDIRCLLFKWCSKSKQSPKARYILYI